MTPAQTIRHALLEYPSLFPCPLAVCHNLFTVIGHGYEWDSNGNLVNIYPSRDNDGKMKYDDLDERREDLQNRDALDCLKSLHLKFKLELDAEYIQRKFIEDNIDDIINSEPLLKLFEYRQSRYGFMHQVSINYAAAFNFPDNINPEWADVLNDFFGEWLVNLNQEYGCSGAKNDYWKRWPAEIIKVREAIMTAMHRLKPVLHGPEWERILAEREDFVKKMIAQIRSEMVDTP